MNGWVSRLVFGLIFLAVPAASDDIWIPIVGSVGQFRTDVRVLNPSYSEDVLVNAYFYPRDSATNATVEPIALTIPRRSMRKFDDVTQSMFNLPGTVLGAIRLQSEDDIEAAARIYARTEIGTLGQFELGIEHSEARQSGAILHLKSFGLPPAGFRTNVGAANPNPTQATVRLRLYDRNDAAVGADKTLILPPYGVVIPTEIRAFFGSSEATTADLADAWVSFTSDVPVLVYGSVVDNATTDPTFITSVADSGIEPPPDSSTAKIINITARQWSFSSDKPIRAQVRERVKFRITSTDVTHGFSMPPYIANLVLRPGVTVESAEFAVNEDDTLVFFCTETLCGEGHTLMRGEFVVGDGGGDDDPPY